MSTKALCVFVLYLVVQTTCAVTSSNKNCRQEHAHYGVVTYDVVTGQLGSDIGSVTKIKVKLLGCNMNLHSGTCYVLLSIPILGIDPDMFMNLKYDDASASMNVSVELPPDSRTIASKIFPVSEPAELCFPLPDVPTLQTCLTFFDMYVRGGILHFCFDLEARFFNTKILVIHFKCVELAE